MLKCSLVASFFAALILSACSKPTDVRFGPQPSEDLLNYSEVLQKLPAGDLAVLSSYVNFAEKTELSGQLNPVIGRTVGEVLQDAKSWQKAQQEILREQKEKEEEAKMRAAKLEHDRKAIQERVLSIITVTLASRTILPPNVLTKRAEPIIRLEYDVENKGSKAILALQGKASYSDLFGNIIVEHPFQIDKTIPIGGKVKIPINYRVSPIWPEMVKLANAEEGKYFLSFSADALSFEDGQTLSVSALENQAALILPNTQFTPDATVGTQSMPPQTSALPSGPRTSQPFSATDVMAGS